MPQKPRPLDPDASAAAFFGAELRRLRLARGLSQARLGQLAHVSGDLIGKVEKAERRPLPDVVRRLDIALNADEALTALARQLGGTDLEREDLDDFPATAVLEWLVRAQPGSCVGTGQGSQVGQGDVAAVRATVRGLEAMDHRFGGGYARTAAVRYLEGQAEPLLAGRFTDSVGRALFGAVAELTFKTGAMAYDVGAHSSAQRYFLSALELARSCGDRALGGKVLAVMSHQENFLDRPERAVDLARAAKLGATGCAPPRVHAMYCAMEARALARQGDSRGCGEAMNEAEDFFSRGTDGEEPQWIQYFDSAELHDEFAHCLRDLRRPKAAARQAELALESSDPAYARSRTFSRLVLVAADVQRGEIERACATATRALESVARLRSSRVRRYVRDIADQMSPFIGTPMVDTFLQRLRAALETGCHTPSPGGGQGGPTGSGTR